MTLSKIFILLTCMTQIVFAELAIIPKPTEVQIIKESYTPVEKIIIRGDKELTFEKKYLSKITNKYQNKGSKFFIDLNIDPNFNIKTEEGAYWLHINFSGVKILAKNKTGIFYGIQTLAQLFELKSGFLPQCTITDSPRFQWRSMMLDSSRHMQSIEFIKRYIDIMASLKMNKFHWHLTDNNGWRIESKIFPQLNQIGSFPAPEIDAAERNGYYTQKQIKEVIAYAKERHIEIIPEIDIPGHVATLIAVFPNLACPTNPAEHIWKERISNSRYNEILCVGNEEVYTFLEKVLNEVCDLFNPQYIHIGGDEVEENIWQKCPLCQKVMAEHQCKTNYDIQKIFMNRICDILTKRNIKTIAWTEKTEQGLPNISIAQGWRNRQKQTLKTAQMNIPSIAADGDYAYLDYPAFPESPKPKWMPLLPLEKVYNHIIIPKDFPVQYTKNILGGECTLWTENLLMKDIDQQLFPRILAFSEQVWSLEKNKNFNLFKENLFQFEKYFQNRFDVKFGKPYIRQNIIMTSPATIKTNLKHARFNYPEYCFDDNSVTSFISEKPIQKDDYLIIDFQDAKEIKEINVLTAEFFCFDIKDGRLINGQLEISKDGTIFTPVATFNKQGICQVKFSKKTMIKAIRILATESQKNPGVFSEIYIK